MDFSERYTFSGVPFPKNFLSIAKTILKRLFRVYAHIYHQHFSEVVQLGEEAHLNTSFKHFIFFVQVNCRLHSEFATRNICHVSNAFYYFTGIQSNRETRARALARVDRKVNGEGRPMNCTHETVNRDYEIHKKQQQKKLLQRISFALSPLTTVQLIHVLFKQLIGSNVSKASYRIV